MENLDLLINNKKIDRRINRTKNAINSSFLRLLKEKDISKITVTELCEYADINRKTFYTYFNSVNSVLSEIENDMMNQFKESLSILKKKKSNISATDIFICVKDLLNLHSKFIHQLVQIDALDSLEKKVKDTIKAAVFEVMQKNENYNNDILDLSLEYIVSGAISIYIEWFYSDSKLPYDVLSNLAIGFINSNIEAISNYEV